MKDLAALGEDLRRDFEAWLDAQRSRWLHGGDGELDDLAAVHVLAADAAALLATCYEAAALEAWLTAGYLPADLGAFDEQATAMALAASGTDAVPRAPDLLEQQATAPASRSLSERPISPAAPPPLSPAAPPLSLRGATGASSSAGQGAGAQPASSGFQRLKGLHELATHVQTRDLTPAPPEPAPEAAAAPGPRMGMQAMPAPAVDARAVADPQSGWPANAVRVSGDEPSPAREPGALDQLRVHAWVARASRHAAATASTDAAGSAGTGIGSAQSGASDAAAPGASLEDLQARFEPLMERSPEAAGDPDAWTGPARSARSSPSPRSGPSAAPRSGQGPGWPDGGLAAGKPEAFEPARIAASQAEPASGPVPGMEPASVVAAAAAALLPSDLDAIVDAIADGLERDFRRLYGGS